MGEVQMQADHHELVHGLCVYVLEVDNSVHCAVLHTGLVGMYALLWCVLMDIGEHILKNCGTFLITRSILKSQHLVDPRYNAVLLIYIP